jgi:hypothetical protein
MFTNKAGHSCSPPFLVLPLLSNIYADANAISKNIRLHVISVTVFMKGD